jgi:hypothetical protein
MNDTVENEGSGDNSLTDVVACEGYIKSMKNVFNKSDKQFQEIKDFDPSLFENMNSRAFYDSEGDIHMSAQYFGANYGYSYGDTIPENYNEYKKITFLNRNLDTSIKGIEAILAECPYHTTAEEKVALQERLEKYKKIKKSIEEGKKPELDEKDASPKRINLIEIIEGLTESGFLLWNAWPKNPLPSFPDLNP